MAQGRILRLVAIRVKHVGPDPLRMLAPELKTHPSDYCAAAGVACGSLNKSPGRMKLPPPITVG